MEEKQDGYKHALQVITAQAKAKTVSKYMKRKIPGELRAEWYGYIVVPALVAYNEKCKNWLKENVK